MYSFRTGFSVKCFAQDKKKFGINILTFWQIPIQKVIKYESLSYCTGIKVLFLKIFKKQSNSDLLITFLWLCFLTKHAENYQANVPVHDVRSIRPMTGYSFVNIFKLKTRTYIILLSLWKKTSLTTFEFGFFKVRGFFSFNRLCHLSYDI